MPPAARLTDKTLHDAPHCHAPIHPAAPVPTPMPHPPQPLPILLNCVATVLIDNLPAAVVTSQTQPCLMASCVPAGPGLIAKGSATVLIGGLPAARAGDLVAFASCIAPIPSPTGKIIPPCSTTTLIGG
ncbi:MAG: PAAR domain-containing protein [Burkholderiales bacterium]|nr:PAAR domain-containing protein [Burkholderiales bacterium]MDE1928905.1 PAAR domain-containing protein [Burkholderiales bacterium]MDE2160098.1 PAAR domain-containing protein [Burkholderiales bacterium]MDE2501525.1 PAAR domain-containing protein [Burkholderiales bacterium]